MKAYELPIQKLHLETREDLAKSLLMLLAPCQKALVKEGSGLFIGNEAAHYSSQVALLEGWSRLLWGLVPLRKGGFSWEAENLHTHGLIEGTDKESVHYWGDVADYDQRMVEMAAIALALLLDPKHYWDILQNREQETLISWLAQINNHDMSPNNWRFFRVLVNMAFEKLERKECNLELMNEDLDLMESMYVGDGWYRDHVPLDNYNPLAMQYYALLYCSFRKEKDPERCDRFAQRAKLFAHQHVHFFTEEGPFVPYGRSLTYRFAVVSFYSACAFANMEVLPYGVLKGIIFRNLRWWFKQPIFDRDGFLTVGYAYPNRTMAEEYNAPGSPYWALKTYLVLALEDDHPFWKAEELPLPTLEKSILLTQPKAIIQHTDDDVVLLNGGQYPQYHMLHCAEKYAKFAYSARYTFSVAASYYEFSSCGCDSMLYVSEDEQYYRPRRDMKVSHLCNEYVCSLWSPLEGVSITTYLIPAESFHVRIHRITTTKRITTKEGGFAISRYKNWEIATPLVQEQQDESSLSLTGVNDVSHISDPLKKRIAITIQPQPNLNLSSPNTIVPVLNQTIEAGKTEVLISCVGAWNKDKPHPQLPKIVYDEEKQEVYIEHLLIKMH
jgi:hypothetical protein